MTVLAQCDNAVLSLLALEEPTLFVMHASAKTVDLKAYREPTLTFLFIFAGSHRHSLKFLRHRNLLQGTSAPSETVQMATHTVLPVTSLYIQSGNDKTRPLPGLEAVRRIEVGWGSVRLDIKHYVTVDLY